MNLLWSARAAVCSLCHQGEKCTDVACYLSLCLDLEEIPPLSTVTASDLLYELSVFICVWECEMMPETEKKKKQKDEQKPVEGGGVTKKTDSDRLAASCWRTVTVEGLFCWDPSSPSRPRVCRSPPGSSSPRHGPEHHNHTPHQRQLQLTLFLLKVYSPLTSGIFLLIWCIFIKSDASM